MNEILKSLHNRKSVRVYTEQEITSEEKQAILRAALQAPTAGNMSLFSILNVTDQALKDALAISCDNQPFIATAPLILIFCADYHRWYTAFSRHNAPSSPLRKPSAGDLLLAFSDATIAAQNAVVAAESLGIGSCYIGDILERYEYHKQLLSLPSHVVPAAMLCFGYPTEQQASRPKPPRFAVEEMVFENRYGSPSDHCLEDMLVQRGSINRDADTVADYLTRFCARKWNCEFSEEMSRSCLAMIADWCGFETTARNFPKED